MTFFPPKKVDKSHKHNPNSCHTERILPAVKLIGDKDNVIVKVLFLHQNIRLQLI